MTINLYLSVTGNQLGRELGNDPEELAYALAEMASSFDGNGLGTEVYRDLPYDETLDVVAFLRDLAEGIEECCQ